MVPKWRIRDLEIIQEYIKPSSWILLPLFIVFCIGIGIGVLFYYAEKRECAWYGEQMDLNTQYGYDGCWVQCNGEWITKENHGILTMLNMRRTY